MEILADQFDKAVSNVTVSVDKAKYVIAAHLEVRALLETNPKLRQWGIDTVLIGSYARDTSRYPAKDADVFLRFTALSVSSDPAEVYAAVAEVLVKRYGLATDGGRVTPQARSLRIDFPSPTSQADLSFSVDAVPAVPLGEHWAIPNRDVASWTDRDVRWIKTSPVKFTEATDALSVDKTSPTVGGRNAYKPVVRLLRQIRHVHIGDGKPGGLYVELCTYYEWLENGVAGDSWAELLANSLDAVSARMRSASSEGLLDPVLGSQMAPALDAKTWLDAADVFADLGRAAHAALSSDTCAAAVAWRRILGQNERGEILPLPPGCGADGLPVRATGAVTSVGSTESRGFASIDT